MDPALGENTTHWNSQLAPPPPSETPTGQTARSHSGAELFKTDEHDRPEPPRFPLSRRRVASSGDLHHSERSTLRSHFVCLSLRKKGKKKKRGETRRKGATAADVKLRPRDRETERADPHAARHQKRARARSREKKGPVTSTPSSFHVETGEAELFFLPSFPQCTA